MIAFWVGGVRSRTDLIRLILRRLVPLIPSLVSAAKRHIPDEVTSVLERIAASDSASDSANVIAETASKTRNGKK